VEKVVVVENIEILKKGSGKIINLSSGIGTVSQTSSTECV
jgi:hypothetical protein